MKKNQLHNASYREIIGSFEQWLDILGYSSSMQANYPKHLCEFLHWLENNNVHKVNHIQKEHVQRYYEYLQHIHTLFGKTE